MAPPLGRESFWLRNPESVTALTVFQIIPGLIVAKPQKSLNQQECIPVGYVPPARYRTGGLCPVGSLSGGSP